MNRALAAYKDVLERASALGIHYAIIRMPEQNTQVLDDLDVILFSADAPRFITFAGENGFSSAPSGSHIFLTKTHDGLPLKFDLHTKLKVGSKGAQIVGDQLDQLVSQAALRQGMYALPQTYEAALLLLRLAFRNDFASPYIRRIRRFSREQLMGLPGLTHYQEHLKEAWDEMDRHWYTARAPFLSLSILHRTLFARVKRVQRAGGLLWNYLRCIRRGAPNLVLFVGPDGSGKTTLSHLLVERKKPNAVWYPMASAPKKWRLFNARWLDFNAKVRQCVDRYPRHSIRRKLLWVIVFVLDYLELHLRLARILYHHPDPAVLVVIDRYPWDQVVTPERAVLPGGVTKLLINLFPNPAVVVLCAGCSRKISQRKQDLTEEEISQTISQYRSYLSQNKIPQVEVNTTDDNPDQSIAMVMKFLGAHREPKMFQ